MSIYAWSSSDDGNIQLELWVLRFYLQKKSAIFTESFLLVSKVLCRYKHTVYRQKIKKIMERVIE